MSFPRETVVCVLILCIGINFFCITSYLIGHYRTLGSGGFIFDILLGLETCVNLASDVVLLNALQTTAIPAQQSPPHAEIVMKLRNFLTLNTGTVLFCCVTHIGASYYSAQHVRVYGATTVEEEHATRNNVFAQMVVFYVLLAVVKAAILHNIYGFYKDFKEKPPSTNVVYVVNALANSPANQGQPVVFVNTNPQPSHGVVAPPAPKR